MNPETRSIFPERWEPAGRTACGARVWIPVNTGSTPPGRKSGPAPDVLYFNDTHGGIDRLLPALKRAIETRKTAGAEWLTLSGGDDHGGGSLWDAGFFNGARESMAFGLLEAAQVDLCVPGNHDLDWGWTEYAERCRLSPGVHRVLSNLRPEIDLPGHYPCLLVEFKEHLMGVLGALCTDQTREAHRYLTVPGDSLPPFVDWLHPHVDSVMVLSHLGYQSRTGEFADQSLLAETPEDVLVLGAHTHDVIPSTGAWHAGRYLQCGQKGRFLGMATGGRGHWRLRVEGVSGSVPVGSGEWASKLESICSAAGSIRFPEASAQAGAPSRDGYRGECATINAATDMLLKREPDPSGVVAALCVRCFGPQPMAGKMTLREWIACLPYGDALCSIPVPLVRLPDLLTANARRLEMPDHYLESRGMLHFSGNFRYTATGSGKSLQVRDIRLAGEPIERLDAKNTEVRLLTQAYVVEGMGGYARVFAEAGLEWSREAVVYEGGCIRELLWKAFGKLDDAERAAALRTDGRVVYETGTAGSS